MAKKLSGKEWTRQLFLRLWVIFFLGAVVASATQFQEHRRKGAKCPLCNTGKLAILCSEGGIVSPEAAPPNGYQYDRTIYQCDRCGKRTKDMHEAGNRPK